MDRDYYLERYLVIRHHLSRALDGMPAYDTSEYRWRIRSKETDEVLYDANGYGYKSARKAHSAYAYMTRSEEEKQEMEERSKHIQEWMREHEEFVRDMDTMAQIAKCKWGPNARFHTKLVTTMLKDHGLEIDFPVYELLREWRKK